MANKYIMNFFISQIVSNTKRDLKKTNPTNKYGELLSISFICVGDEKQEDGVKVVQRCKFENYEGDYTMPASEARRFQKALSINVKNEIEGINHDKKKCKFIFARIGVKEKTIVIQWQYIDGTHRELVL